MSQGHYYWHGLCDGDTVLFVLESHSNQHALWLSPNFTAFCPFSETKVKTQLQLVSSTLRQHAVTGGRCQSMAGEPSTCSSRLGCFVCISSSLLMDLGKQWRVAQGLRPLPPHWKFKSTVSRWIPPEVAAVPQENRSPRFMLDFPNSTCFSSSTINSSSSIHDFT